MTSSAQKRQKETVRIFQPTRNHAVSYAQQSGRLLVQMTASRSLIAGWTWVVKDSGYQSYFAARFLAFLCVSCFLYVFPLSFHLFFLSFSYSLSWLFFYLPYSLSWFFSTIANYYEKGKIGYTSSKIRKKKDIYNIHNQYTPRKSSIIVHTDQPKTALNTLPSNISPRIRHLSLHPSNPKTKDERAHNWTA